MFRSVVSAGAESGRCITGASALAPAANHIGTAAASGNAGGVTVSVATPSATSDQHIGVVTGAPTACVVCVRDTRPRFTVHHCSLRCLRRPCRCRRHLWPEHR